MAGIRVFVEISDKYLWTLSPFTYLFNTFWSELQPVVVIGYNKPDYQLPPNFTFHQVSLVNYPADRWSDGMIQFLNSQEDEHFVFLLCDYWMLRTVDVRGVAACHDYVTDRPDVLRIDLTDDRLYAGGMFDVESWGCYDIIETPHGTPYQFSTQAGIWNRKLMLQLLENGKSAWDTEIHTQPPPEMRILGTRQAPVRYANAVLKGKIDTNQLQKIPRGHFEHISQWIPKDWKNE